MTSFKAKLSKQGNSFCIYVPKRVRTELSTDIEYEWSVRTDVVPELVITGKGLIPEKKPFNTTLCNKHPGSMKGTCGCR